MDIPIMPESFKGEINKQGQFTNTAPRKWTKEEIDWCISLKEKGYSNKDIAVSVSRSDVSVNIKLKRLTKKDNTYNEDHVIDKYEVNKKFIEMINPKTILDVYCGKYSFYRSTYGNIKVTTNDIDDSIDSDYTMDALKFLCMLYSEGKNYDLIDLDPFGSSAECFDLAIKMAKKAIVITLGEIGHKRWKRTDFVERYYGIENLEDFTSDNIIKEIIKIGEKHKKKLIPVYKKDWRNISRVWFKIEKFKITKQWDVE